MSSIVVEPTGLDDVIRMIIVNEALNLLAVLFIILALIFVFDLSLDIEELSSPVALVAFAPVTLQELLLGINIRDDDFEGWANTYSLDIIVIFIVLILIIFVVVAFSPVVVLVTLLILVIGIAAGAFRSPVCRPRLLFLVLVIPRARALASIFAGLLVVRHVSRGWVEVIVLRFVIVVSTPGRCHVDSRDEEKR